MWETTGRGHRGKLEVAVTLVALAATLAGCGATSGNTTAPMSLKAISLTPPATGCGSVPMTKLDDPDDLVAGLPAVDRAAYVDYDQPVLKSAWANWKPNHPGPYRVAIVWGPVVNQGQVLTLDTIESQLKRSPEIKSVIASTQATLNVPAQLQQMSAAAQSGADLIITEPGEAEAFAGPVNQVAAKGVPVVTVLGGPAVATAINVDPNTYEAAAQSAARAMQIIGGKGSVLIAHGVEGIDVDNEESAAFAAVLARCPQVKDVGTITGDFDTATSKSQTLQFLSTHPQPISAVLEVADMAPGIMSAFQQSGRPVPLIDDIGNEKASLGYWRANGARYQGVGTGLPPIGLGDAVADVALRTLEGQGPKLNVITQQIPLITGQNLDTWSEATWNLRTPGVALGPSVPFMSDAFLNPLFTHGSTPN